MHMVRNNTYDCTKKWVSHLSIFVPGDPKSQPRQRHRIIHRNGKTSAYNYTPKMAPVQIWKESLLTELKLHAPNEQVRGPVKCSFTFIFPRPKSHYRTGKFSEHLKSSAPFWHSMKPDRDNLDKAVLDAITKAGIWNDDCQVCAGYIMKTYTSGKQKPGVQILIERLEQ
jgi:Holliday junction resolvase RusA-like endonuclease